MNPACGGGVNVNILLTGANGFVGQRIRTVLPVIAAPSLRGASSDDVRRMIDAAEPDVIIHTAAISDIGACERSSEASWHANVLVPTYIAKAAGAARQIYFSSDQVYGGAAHPGPYGEADAAPANTYARHKLAMEEAVLAAAPGAILLRATWMYDMPLHGADNRGNFLMGLLLAAAHGEPLTYSDTQVRGITYVREAADKVAQLIRSDVPGGVYNFGSENALDMLTTARQCADILGLRVNLLPGEHRHDLNMDGSKLRQYGIDFNSTVEGVRRCKADYAL